eukprot:gene11142-43210_t
MELSRIQKEEEDFLAELELAKQISKQQVQSLQPSVDLQAQRARDEERNAELKRREGENRT